MDIRKVITLLLLLPGLCLPLAVMAEAGSATVSEYFGVDLDPETRADLQTKINEITADKDKYAEFMEAARHRTVLCKACHGEDGKAVKPVTPNLAGQNMDYLIDQIKRYQSGDRYDFWMGGLSKGFSDEDIIKVAIRYSNMPGVVSGDGAPELLEQGKGVFQKSCVECHGEEGKGNQGYARLAGQQSDYVVKILKEFRDRTGRRTNPWMTAVALRLSEVEMEAVASYISHMQ